MIRPGRLVGCGRQVITRHALTGTMRFCTAYYRLLPVQLHIVPTAARLSRARPGATGQPAANAGPPLTQPAANAAR